MPWVSRAHGWLLVLVMPRRAALNVHASDDVGMFKRPAVVLFFLGACVRACVRAGECARGCLCTCDAVSHLRTPCGFEPVHALKHALMFWCGSTAPGALNQAGVFVPFFGHRYHRFSSRAYVRYLPFIRRLDPILQNTSCATLADVLVC